MSEPSIDYATRARPDALTSSGNTVAEADVCFVSHTAIRSAGPIAPLEATGGIPVTTSNQGLAWHTLNRLASPTPRQGFPGCSRSRSR
jgi:maleate cis-trans isomerase